MGQKTQGYFSDYRCFRSARGGVSGDTHANRYYSGTVIHADGKKILGIGSYDRSSSYPDVVLNCVFPMTRFVYIGSITENDIEKKLDRGKALLFRCKIIDSCCNITYNTFSVNCYKVIYAVTLWHVYCTFIFL